MKILQHWKVGDAALLEWMASEGLVAREIPSDSLLVVIANDGTAHALYREYDIHHVVGPDGREHAVRRPAHLDDDAPLMKTAWRARCLASAPPGHCYVGSGSLALPRVPKSEVPA